MDSRPPCQILPSTPAPSKLDDRASSQGRFDNITCQRSPVNRLTKEAPEPSREPRCSRLRRGLSCSQAAVQAYLEGRTSTCMKLP